MAIWDTMLHTPLIVRGPSFPKGKRVRHLVQTVDIFPTILELAEIEEESAKSNQRLRLMVKKEMQGKSLLSALGDEPIREFAMAEVQKPLEPFAIMKERCPDFDPRVINRQWKCARTLEYKYCWASDLCDELYNIQVDPDEQKNIIGEKPEIASELRKKLEDFLLSIEQRDYGDYLNTNHLKIDKDVLARLKAWGLIRDIIGAKRHS